VDKLQEQLDFERSHYGLHVQQLTDQLAILQTENQWLTADRMQHMERVVRSSLEGDKTERFQTPGAGSDVDSKESMKQLADAQASGVLDELRTALLNEQHKCSKLQSTCDDFQLQLQSARSCVSALHDELSSSEVNLQEAARAGFEFSLLADQRAEKLAGERTRHEAERLELCKELQFAKETLLELQALQASSKAQMLEAQKQGSEQEQSLLDELTEALALNKSLKADLAHAEGALYTAMCARELAGESSLVAARGLAEERAAALAVCDLAARSEAELKAELEDSRRVADDTKQALEARLVEMQRQLQAAMTGDCKGNGCIDHEASALEFGPTPVVVQLAPDGNAIADRVKVQLPAMPAEEIEQDVRQQSSVADCWSRPEELLARDSEKDEHQDLRVHSRDRLSEQVAKGGKESRTPLCPSAGIHGVLRSCALRATGTPLRFMAMLGAFLLMCGILGGGSLDISTDMTCADPGDEAGLQTDQWPGQPQK